MDAVKKALHRARGTRPKKKERDTSLDWVIPYKTKAINQRRWEREKKIVRNDNFNKMIIAKKKQLDAISAEKKRQADIAEARRKNLAKARKKLKKLRSKNGNSV